MSNTRKLIWLAASTMLLFACAYIVTPAPDVTPTSPAAQGWSGVVLGVGPGDGGGLRVDIAIRNGTADWSAMEAIAGQPAVLTAAGGQTTDCSTVVVGTGGNRLPPGFQTRGFTGGTKSEPKTQLLHVECQGAVSAPGMKLSVPYRYETGSFNFYVPSPATNAKMELNLDEVDTGLTFPIAEPAEGEILKSDASIPAINGCILNLKDVKRTEAGFEFSWETQNPGEYPTYVHIGNPPVIGADGIIYGFFESPHLADAPITPSGQTADWTTQVAVPAEVKGLYLLVSVETKQQRLFISHVVDITGK